MTELPSAIRLAGCRDQRLNPVVELHFVIVQDEPLDRRIRLEIGQRFATPVEEPLRPRAQTVILLRSARRMAVAWAPQVSLAIRLHFEVPVVDRPDLLLKPEVELHFEIARDGRRDLQLKAGEWRTFVQ